MTGRVLELVRGRAMHLFVLKLSHQTRRELQKNLIRCALSKQLEKRYFLALDSGIIDEEVFLLLYEENTSKNPSFGNEDYNKFDFNSIDPATSKADFRVEKNDLSMLKEALNIPDQIVCHQSSICDGMEALCKVLKRLAYPCRYSDMILLFARPVPVLIFGRLEEAVEDRLVQGSEVIYCDLRTNRGQWSQESLEAILEADAY